MARAPEFPQRTAETRPFRDARAARWIPARKLYGHVWSGKHLPDGSPDFIGEALEEPVDGATYVGCEVARVGRGDWRLTAAAEAFELAWMLLRIYRSTPARDASTVPPTGHWVPELLRTIRHQVVHLLPESGS